MAAPSMVFTARFAAKHFGVDINVIEELAEELEIDREQVVESIVAAKAYQPQSLDVNVGDDVVVLGFQSAYGGKVAATAL